MLPRVNKDGGYRPLGKLGLADLEAIRLVLRGGSIIDWHRLNFESESEALELIRAQELDPNDPDDQAQMESVKTEAISYLRRHFDFPIPKPVARLELPQLMMLAAGKGHRQLCACTILKVMHIIHHLQGRELLFTLPISDRDMFYMVEEKVYRVIGGMLARGFPILEFVGGRKNQDSLYTKLLSKPDTIAANIYDKLRFRIVTRSPDDIFPVINYMLRHIFPFNYVIPGQSTNTLFHFRSYCEQHPHLRELMSGLQLSPDLEDDLNRATNRFSANDYQVLHFVVDMPVRLTAEVAALAKGQLSAVGSIVFVQAEFQIIDRHTEQHNEIGEASHEAYKERQKQAVMRRLKVGNESARRAKKDK